MNRKHIIGAVAIAAALVTAATVIHLERRGRA